MGIGNGLGVPLVLTAGMIVSGAYFGDKMSPLSDSTNLSPAVSGSNLFDHIRVLLWTTTPTYNRFGGIGRLRVTILLWRYRPIPNQRDTNDFGR